jgi:glycosyltransferase involved in cell wall biosynthesis
MRSSEALDVTVVLPAYNEALGIRGVIEALGAVDLGKCEILVVDDGSSDDTARLAAEAGARVVRHPHNMGNGAAVKSGLREARGRIVVLMDADGQHHPRHIPALLAETAHFEMVVGARSSGQAGWHRSIANEIYNRFASYVTEYPILDLTSGFRAMRRTTALGFLSLLPNTFSYPTTLTMAFLHSGLPVKYVPIPFQPRIGRSKIRLLDDGLRFFLIITRIATLYSPLRVFLPVATFFFFSGLGYYLYTYVNSHRFTNFGLFLLVSAVIIFMMGLISEQIALMRMERSSPRPEPDEELPAP